jgi:GGDEF domain-containing protein
MAIDVPLTASAGHLVLDPGEDLQAHAAFRAADLALHRAKNEGRNRSVAAERLQHPWSSQSEN